LVNAFETSQDFVEGVFKMIQVNGLEDFEGKVERLYRNEGSTK